MRSDMVGLAVAFRRRAEAWFMDLRDTAVSALAEAGCAIPDIAAITDLCEAAVHGVLKHDPALTSAMPDSAIAKPAPYEERRANESG